MKWTTKLPKESGFYWFRWTPEHSAEVKEVRKNECGCFYNELSWVGGHAGEWSSEPIKEPEGGDAQG